MKPNLSDRSRKILITVAAVGLGNLLAFFSTQLTPMHPQVSFDFSHLATFAIALAFGPIYGAVTGALVSIFPYFQFGVQGIWGPVAGLAIVVGKAMTGLFCGLLRHRAPAFLAVTISYIPESAFTMAFVWVMSFILPADLVTWDIASSLFIEGWAEVILFSFIIQSVTHRRVIETAVLMLEIFIIMFLVHKEFLQTLLLLLLIAFFTLILFELVEKIIRRPGSKLPENKDRE